MYVRTVGYDNAMRLSQYIGDFHPLAQVNGFLGSNFIALICISNSAIFLAVKAS
jgi:hypothetical protein